MIAVVDDVREPGIALCMVAGAVIAFYLMATRAWTQPDPVKRGLLAVLFVVAGTLAWPLILVRLFVIAFEWLRSGGVTVTDAQRLLRHVVSMASTDYGRAYIHEQHVSRFPLSAPRLQAENSGVRVIVGGYDAPAPPKTPSGLPSQRYPRSVVTPLQRGRKS